MTETKAGRIPGLDLLRAIAILIVFIFHYQFKGFISWLAWLSWWGWTGVDLFFVMSGYLIANQLLKPIKSGESPSLKTFYLKRSLRVLPAYLAVVALHFLVPVWNHRDTLPPLWKFLTFTLNFNLDWRYTPGFTHAWSLSIEEQFYLALPALLLFSFSRSWVRPKTIAIALPVTILIVGVCLRAYLYNHFIAPLVGGVDYDRYMADYSKIIHFPTYNRLDALSVGVAIAVLLNFKSGFKKWNENFPNVSALSGFAFLALACWFTRDRFSFSAAVLGYPAFALGYGGLVLSATAPRSILNRLRVPGAATLATLSYSLYLVHFRFVESRHFFESYIMLNSELVKLLGLLGIALVGATILHVTVERPFLKLRDRLVLKS